MLKFLHTLEIIYHEKKLRSGIDPCPPCLQSGTINVLHVTDDNGMVLDTLLIMVETQNLTHMFGGNCDHKILSHWAEGPENKHSVGAKMKVA